VHGFSERLATGASLAAMLTPTVLFSAWTIPEFDMVGGAIVLFAAAEVKQGRRWQSVVLLALALLTKETTAIFMLAYLLSFACWNYRERSDAPWLVGVYVLALLAAVLPILMVEPPVTHEFNMADGEFEWIRVIWLLFHNASQVFYVIGPAGALLALAVIPGGTRLHWALIGLSCALFFAAPILRHYNHYESIVFSHWFWVLVWLAVFAAAMFRTICWGSRDLRILSVTILLGFLGLLAGPVLASFTRADLSARLYAPVIPMMYGLALLGASQLLTSVRRSRRVIGALALTCFVWHPIAGAYSAWQINRARFPVELTAKSDLLETLGPPCPLWVFYTNRDHELAQEEFAFLGEVSEEAKACTRLIQLSQTATGSGTLWEDPAGLEGYDQHRVKVETAALGDRLRLRQPLPVTVMLYVQGARSQMAEEVNRELDVDFEWATQRMPEVNTGYLRQSVGMIYVPDTPLERLFEDASPYRRRVQLPFYQLPLWLNELPHRLIFGVPLLERYRYQATLYSIPYGETPTGSPEPAPARGPKPP
jgi:hypothetical protein